MKADWTVDAKGLSCPMPLVRAKKGMDRLNSGDVLELISTDPGSKNDFKAWVRTAGHELIDVHEADGVYTIYVKKK
ncbi:sulfurtransferase TusA family protein [Kroppenstedtia eburnea]|uniref:TusA-related sulfurtransferase n=1 Tax=Kroppenstedtia eburnea TaxID=714067 RepID=A0A1N7NW47_9BACL|nr:sulfurtransferase TusA family protein [Kroppenstedtia eburnea]QKI81192.1 sulfurtransferase TusA family protein [Kroppenstedtia eburnea]SIT02511.1 TusA-related sulfurtransferase [Kroppenstedtia eburnea]